MRGLIRGTDLLADFLPNDPSHLVSVKFDDRVRDDDLFEGLSHVVCIARSWEAQRGTRRGPGCMLCQPKS